MNKRRIDGIDHSMIMQIIIVKLIPSSSSAEMSEALILFSPDGRQPHRKTPLQEDNLTGRKPDRKTT